MRCEVIGLLRKFNKSWLGLPLALLGGWAYAFSLLGSSLALLGVWAFLLCVVVRLCPSGNTKHYGSGDVQTIDSIYRHPTT